MVDLERSRKIRTQIEIETAFAPKSELDQKKFLYLVGIGGAGMSGLAELALSRGFRVEGSDVADQPSLARLAKLGIRVALQQNGKIPSHVDAVVVSDAIDLGSNPDVVEAKSRHLPLFRRSQLLGHLVKDWRVIAVTGTHGKTTTTGLLGSAMKAAGLDPLVIVGAPLVGREGPVQAGYGDWAVVEACEAYNGMLDLDPEWVLLTNLELDHVDFHGNFENLKMSMSSFIAETKDKGGVVYSGSDPGACEVAQGAEALAIPYHSRSKPFSLSLLGAHNQLNASGAYKLVEAAFGKETAEASIAGLESFQGAKRRLEVLQTEPVVVIDDYAHTPTEIESSLKAVRERFRDRKITVVYQPHLYSRTHRQEVEFGRALDLADQVVLTDIYPAREKPIPGVSSAVIAEHVSKPCHYVASRHLLPRRVAGLVDTGEVVVGMGAGTIETFAPDFIQEFAHRQAISGVDRPSRKEIKVAVAYGGSSSEREVSILSGLEVMNGLKEAGFSPFGIDISDRLLSGQSLMELAGPHRPDVVFLAVHGTDAEDGSIQGLLDLLHIPYTGSGLIASAKAMDKAFAKEVFAIKGIRTPNGVIYTQPVPDCPFPLPVVVKPNAEGSTIGLTFVRSWDKFEPALRKALSFGKSALVEEEIIGMEVSTPVLCGKPLLPIEIAPKSGVYDFQSKYVAGATEEIIPARLNPKLLTLCQEIAVECHVALGCKGATRTDMIVNPNGAGKDSVTVLEINTLPGMTSTSLLPASAAAMGISFADVCAQIVFDALGDHNANGKG